MRRDQQCVGVGSWLGLGLAIVTTLVPATAAGRGPRSDGTLSRAYVEARALFEKDWKPTPGAGHGDGLGPLYNESSCVACHNQGGPGGGGTNNHNVTLISLVPGLTTQETGPNVFQGEPEALHPGLRNSTSVVLHHHATSPTDEKRLDALRSFRTVQTRDELFAVKLSSRNSPALFGVGRIDAIDDKILLAAEARSDPAFPEIRGRVSRLKDGRIGRFGWKAQVATLRDFVLAACSNELGLEVPGRHQASLVAPKDFDPSKLVLDLDENETRKLVDFVRELPQPSIRLIDPIGPFRGRIVFDSIGCAACHSPRLGAIDGIYSDLLLHDLGASLNDAATYYGAPSSSAATELAAGSNNQPRPTGGATPTEWRTPPLWGIATSPPYLHDGRAQTLDEAIRLHGGEATATTKRYAQLSFADNQALLSMLHSLIAPPQALRLVDAAGKRGRVGRR
jgi:CxxC motif-containing protein (DUF1111 family)